MSLASLGARRSCRTTTCAGKGKGLGSADSSFRAAKKRETVVEQENVRARGKRRAESRFTSRVESRSSQTPTHGPDPRRIPAIAACEPPPHALLLIPELRRPAFYPAQVPLNWTQWTG